MQDTIAIVGNGRLGRALASALRTADPHGRGYAGAGADVVLLCVPDAEIAAAAAAIAPGPLVGHCSGATGLAVLAPHEAFALHPLMTVTHAGADFAGAGCAIGGSTPRALDLARRLAAALGMRAFEIADEDRTAYHAGASMAANFLVDTGVRGSSGGGHGGRRARTARPAGAGGGRALGGRRATPR